MKLSALIKHTPIKGQMGSMDVEITGVSIDSRTVKKNFVFIAITGENIDGHNFIHKAIQKGAVAVIHEKPIPNFQDNVSYILSGDTRNTLAHVANTWFDNPSKKMLVYGITGTNGKTTISYFLAHLLRSVGLPSAIIGTTGAWTLNKHIPLKNTTPDILTINSILKTLVEQGVKAVCLEVSSHGLEQKRVEGIDFDAGIFTNLTRDHLDYHVTFEKYLAAKQILFNQLKPDSLAIVNSDDPAWGKIVENTKAKIIKVGTHKDADYQIIKTIPHPSLNTLVILHQSEKMRMKTNTMGNFNYSNLLQAFSLISEKHEVNESVLKTIKTLPNVPGRLERIETKYNYPIFVDYAHTPDAMENVLTTLRGSFPEKKIITIFGCGGDRDKGKRPLMGAIADKYSDRIIITDDNPRFEDSHSIIDDIVLGIPNLNRFNTITPRIKAILTALEVSNHDTVLAILGKGHEDYQDIQGELFPYNDIDIIKGFFK